MTTTAGYQDKDVIELDPNFSTTRMVTREKPVITNDPSSKVQSLLFLPPNPERRAEGGLRTKGYFKQSYDKANDLSDNSPFPLVTIITVVFNGQTYLEQTIQSVINQTYNNIEYIIIDGSSTDGTLDIIRQYENKIDYWVSEPDAGIYDAMNKGLKLCWSDYVYFLGADDTLSTNHVIGLISKFLKESQCRISMVYGDVFNKSLNKLKKQPSSRYLFSYLNICHQAIFYNRETLLSINGFDLKYPICADYVANIKLWNAGAVYIPIDICKYGGNGISSIKIDQVYVAERDILILNNLGIISFIFQILIRPIHRLVQKNVPRRAYSEMVQKILTR